MKGVRALASGMLVLCAVCLVPAVSAAQEGEATTTTTPTTAVPERSPPAPDPAEPAAKPDDKNRTDDEQVQDEQTTAAAPAAQPAAAVQPSAPVAQASASASVTMGDFFFSPASVSVAVGDTVTWRNTGQAPHNAVANDGSFSTPNLNNGQSASHRFTKAGSFGYICTIHPQMTGTVRVLSASGGGGGGAPSGGSRFSGTSEADAVASPDAAGSSTFLPATGIAAGVLALIGLALLTSGLVVRRAADEADRSSRFLTIF